MLTVMLNALLGLLICAGLGLTGGAIWGWAVFWGVIVFLAGQGLAGFLIQKKVKAAMGGVQKILEDGQRRLQFKINQWQMRPPSSPKQAQMELEKEQRVFVERAIEASKAIERFSRWAPLMMRQVATMRAQLYWMLKDFKKVDELLPKALIVDPLMAAIKIARMHMRGEKDIDKVFRKYTARVRYGDGALLYGLYSWILVQNKDLDGAHRVLLQACDKLENETIKANRDHLANNRLSQFSNAGFGEQWYALHLEQPKVKMQRQPRYSGRPF